MRSSIKRYNGDKYTAYKPMCVTCSDYCGKH